MKKTSIISLLIGCMLFGTVVTSCEDMLSPDSSRHSYEVAGDTLYSYWGIVKSLQNVAERYIVLGECRGELVSGTGYVSDSITALLNFDMSQATDGSCRFLRASDYYHIINSCNAYLAQCDTLRTTGTLQPYMLKEAAQVAAIRAWVYLQLVQVYGEVPFYTKPLLTTDDINAFMVSPDKVNIDNLADRLAPELEKALQVERLYGLPQYDNYKNVCHSTKVMIPLNLILGDLYLAKGDPQSCEKAAQYYYDYLSNNQGQGLMKPGGALPDRNICYGYKGEGMERPIYGYTGNIPWTETGAVASDRESVTCIPSSTNKLWGTVLRGVNQLYGYDSEISVRTSDVNDTTSTTSASVIIRPQYDVKQLMASDAYYDLCKAQQFEICVGASSSTVADLVLTVDTVIGDARQHWVQEEFVQYENGITNREWFIKKINPTGSFSTVAHMIYRKSMIWLRYAEALNRAGYPSYAFAILKNGLCKNDAWYPIPNSPDYAARDSSWAARYNDEWYPADWMENATCPTRESLIAYIDQLIADSVIVVDEETQIPLQWRAVTYENYPDDGCQAVLYYLDKREVERSPSFLNFSFEELNGNMAAEQIYYRTSLTERGIASKSVAAEGDDKFTKGIHAHGCGTVPLVKNKESVYDYVKQISKKAQENYGVTLTKADIYSGSYDDVVKNCVEDLIVDEEALELAFEGTRFFDLLRVAHRRGDANYLASRVARRDPALLGKLQNSKNWYFPLPTK